jgi:hypothetical protein
MVSIGNPHMRMTYRNTAIRAETPGQARTRLDSCVARGAQIPRSSARLRGLSRASARLPQERAHDEPDWVRFAVEADPARHPRAIRMCELIRCQTHGPLGLFV